MTTSRATFEDLQARLEELVALVEERDETITMAEQQENPCTEIGNDNDEDLADEDF